MGKAVPGAEATLSLPSARRRGHALKSFCGRESAFKLFDPTPYFLLRITSLFNIHYSLQD